MNPFGKEVYKKKFCVPERFSKNLYLQVDTGIAWTWKHVAEEEIMIAGVFAKL
jgi:hypothetical protein